jgi:hypothetical protein
MKLVSILKSMPIVCLSLSFSLYSLGQTGANNFPTIGNATVGTAAAPNNLTVNGTLTTNGTSGQTGGTVTSTSGFSTYMLTNSANASQSTNLAPGVLVYGDRWFDYGMDIGYNPSVGRFRTRIFSPLAADVALSYINESGTIPTNQSQLTDGLIMLGNSGNILIGKASQTNSTYKLDVAGNVRANQVTVNTTGADFVFDSSYALPALSEVAAYIKAHHHLSQIAPAADMQKDGLNLGDDQTRLLQKVEELTLYAIEADKHIQQLEALLKQQDAVLQEVLRKLQTSK